MTGRGWEELCGCCCSFGDNAPAAGTFEAGALVFLWKVGFLGCLFGIGEFFCGVFFGRPGWVFILAWYDLSFSFVCPDCCRMSVAGFAGLILATIHCRWLNRSQPAAAKIMTMTSIFVNLLYNHFLLTREVMVFLVSMVRGHGWDSSGGGASFSIRFKALKIELKIKYSSNYCRINRGISKDFFSL